MHQYYAETINVCNTAKLMLEQQERVKLQEKFGFMPSHRSSQRGLHNDLNPEDSNINHYCHRHWAFALYKKGDMGKACKMIK